MGMVNTNLSVLSMPSSSRVIDVCPWCAADIRDRALVVYDPEEGQIVDFECPECSWSIMYKGEKLKNE